MQQKLEKLLAAASHEKKTRLPFWAGLTNLVWRCRKDEVRSLRLASADRHVLRFCPVLFLPSRYSVFTSGQALNFERPIVTRHRIVSGLEHDKVTVHPRMDVALD